MKCWIARSTSTCGGGRGLRRNGRFTAARTRATASETPRERFWCRRQSRIARQMGILEEIRLSIFSAASSDASTSPVPQLRYDYVYNQYRPQMGPTPAIRLDFYPIGLQAPAVRLMHSTRYTRIKYPRSIHSDSFLCATHVRSTFNLNGHGFRPINIPRYTRTHARKRFTENFSIDLNFT